MNFFKDKFSRPKKTAEATSVTNSSLVNRSGVRQQPYFTSVESPQNGSCQRSAQGFSTRVFPGSVSTGSFTPFQSSNEIKTFPRSATTQTFHPISRRERQNGSITSSSQSSDESEEAPANIRVPRRRSGYRSTSLPRHSSASNYRRSITMPNIQSQDDSDTANLGNNKEENNLVFGQITPIRSQNTTFITQTHPPQNSVQLTTWLQSLSEIPCTTGLEEKSSKSRSKSSKTEILRISRGRLKDDQPSPNQLDNKRKRNSSRENSLESLLEEEDQTSEDCASRESLTYLDEEQSQNQFRPRETKNSLECLLEEQSNCKVPLAVKNKSNSLPKSAFSNIQLRVQEIRDQLEVLKQSSHISGSKALQQVFPRIRPPTLTQEFLDEGFEDSKKKCSENIHYSTPVNPINPIYTLASESGTEVGHRRLDSSSVRPGFLNNRPLSMPSPPLQNSPGNSPNSISPRSLSPNPHNSPKHNIRPSTCYQSHIQGKSTLTSRTTLPNAFTEFGPSPQSSPSTLSPCSSNSLPSSQAKKHFS